MLPGSETGTPDLSEPTSVLTFLVYRHINFSDATPDELEQLTQACEPASFGVHQEDVLDESRLGRWTRNALLRCWTRFTPT